MSKRDAYQPVYTLTTAILCLVAEIGEWIGRYSALAESALTPRLRRANRIRSIQASLAIENNTLTLEQVTAVIDGNLVLGTPREIREVQNAFAAYEAMKNWNPSYRKDLLAAHGVLMDGLVATVGAFRRGGVGIFRGERMVHMAPPAERVPQQIDDLSGWLQRTDAHPLVAGCVFHYELEFIHPFTDGNGRMGRLWQTLILYRWKPLLAYLPVETVVRERQEDYYRVLAQADMQADATPFIAFMLESLRAAIEEAVSTDQVNDYVNDQVARILTLLAGGESSSSNLMKALGLSHRPSFRKNYLDPAISDGWIERTQPDAPRSPTQRYRLTDKGRRRQARRTQ